jgi:hypothetical protein
VLVLVLLVLVVLVLVLVLVLLVLPASDASPVGTASIRYGPRPGPAARENITFVLRERDP